MPRPLTLALSVACIGAIGLLLLLFLKRDKHPVPARLPDPDPVAMPAPAVGDIKPLPRPAPPETRRLALPPVSTRPDARQPADETSLMTQLHELAGSNPELSLKLAREAVTRFPDSANAPEFEWNVVKALFNMGRIDEAEAEARIMLSKYPGNYFTGDVVHHLLNHPPNPSDVPQ